MIVEKNQFFNSSGLNFALIENQPGRKFKASRLFKIKAFNTIKRSVVL